MGSQIDQPRSNRWPTLLLLAGVSGLLPLPVVRRAHALVEQIVGAARGWLEPNDLVEFAAADVAALATESDPPAAGIDPQVVALLSALRDEVRPPKSGGWQRDGRFGVVPVGARRDVGELSLATPAAIPLGEPVFFGRELVGFTAARAAGPTLVQLLSRPGTRIAACAGVPGVREVRFLAIGEGVETLRVAYADGGQQLEEGDLAWAIDPPSLPGAAVAPTIGGAQLGRVVHGDLASGAALDEWRIVPITAPARLAEVAIRFPPGFPLASEPDLYPMRTTAIGHAVVEERRRVARVVDGHEVGIDAGCAVSSAGRYVGRISRSSWGAALVRAVSDPGFRLSTLLLVGGRVSAWELESGGTCADGLLLLPPPIESWDGAIVVTASSPDGTPEGLIVGALRAIGDGCVLVGVREPLGAVEVWRPAGAWSAPP